METTMQHSTLQYPLYQRLSQLLTQRANCEKSKNNEWFDKSSAKIVDLVAEHMPSGSGFDNGTKLDFARSTEEKLVFVTSFHHMNENGYYDGWTDHDVIVRPSLFNGITLSISGRNRRDIKDYIHQLFSFALKEKIAD